MSKSYRFVLGRDKYHLLNDITAWCRNNIGEGARIFEVDLLTADNIEWNNDFWLVKTSFGTSVFAFREGKDAVLFALKWQD